jgi:hypothetical protein
MFAAPNKHPIEYRTWVLSGELAGGLGERCAVFKGLMA